MRYVLLIIILLISYGSLYPFKFSGEILKLDEFFSWFFEMNFQTTRADKLANILLFVPYGFVAMIALSSHRRQLLLGTITFGFGILLAFSLQYLQLYLPARVPDSVDALYNSLGILVGVVCAYLLRQYSHSQQLSARSLLDDWSQMTMPILLAMIWILWRLYPYMPLFTAESIAASVQPLLIAPALSLTTVIQDAVGWLMFFYLISRAPFRGIPRFKLLQLTLFIFALEVLIKNNQVTAGDLLAALAAFALFTSSNPRQVKQSLVSVAAIGLMFMSFNSYSTNATHASFNWLPFYQVLKVSPWLSVQLLLNNLFFIASFIYLLRKTMFNWLGATTTCGIGLLIIEITKGLLPNYSGDITNPILALILGLAMSQFETLAKRERAVSLNQ